ncbi:DUF4236 domain-containing protein [Chitinophaga sp.]|uniref:DUF4236 domain-containing protein n=1 Tax=Chitinophaga sp. TaxID=1869181 RepID=UPI0031D66A39
MGWSFRKSLSAGPFRMNFSKSGISYSMGVKGARINTGPRGTYVSLSAYGISYRQKISGPAPLPSPVADRSPGAADNNIASAPVEELTDTDSQAFIAELNRKCAQVSYAKGIKLPMLLILVALLFTSWGTRERIVQPAADTVFVRIQAFNGANIRQAPNVKSRIIQMAAYDQKYTLLDTANPQWLKVGVSDSAGYVNRDLAEINHLSYKEVKEEERYLVNNYLGYEIVLWVVGFVLLVRWLKKVDKKRFTMELHYDMDDKYQQVYQQFREHFITFLQSSKIWQYLNAQATNDYKRNAGAGKLIRRISVRRLSENKVPAPYFITNVSIPCISLYNMELYFLPERMLIKRGNTFAAVFYKNLRITGHDTNFIESEPLPRDARVIDYTWQYVNKSGGPDRRFNNNRKLPVCLYSQYTFTSDTGFFEIIATSKLSAMDDFAGFVLKIGALQSRMRACYQ